MPVAVDMKAAKDVIAEEEEDDDVPGKLYFVLLLFFFLHEWDKRFVKMSNGLYHTENKCDKMNLFSYAFVEY